MHEKNRESLIICPYRCVSCGAGATALTRSYGPTVLKLATCKECGGIVDKYIEYDPVIVMIDLILVMREAQRHVLHNTKFHIFWKLLVILALLETYGVWCKNNIINLVIETICHNVDTAQQWNQKNCSIPYVLSALSEFGQNGCSVWRKEVKIDDIDPFISEKAFYIAFASVCAGTVAFTCTIHILMKIAGQFCKEISVSALSLLKTVSLGNMSSLFTLPLLIWGISDAHTKTIHILLVFAYSYLVFTNALTVIYNLNIYFTMMILMLAYWSKLTIVYTTKCLLDSFM